MVTRANRGYSKGSSQPADYVQLLTLEDPAAYYRLTVALLRGRVV